MKKEDINREREIATVEVDQQLKRQEEDIEKVSSQQRPLIEFGKAVGAVGGFGMMKAFSELMEIQSLKHARDAFNNAKSLAVGELVDGCGSWTSYCAHHGIDTGDAKMRITLLVNLGEDFIRNASVIGLARRDYRALMALPSGEQSELIANITSVEIQTLEQARQVKEEFRSVLEIFQEKLTEKDETIRVFDESNQILKEQVGKSQNEKEKRQSVEEELRLVMSERDLYKTGDRPSHSLEQVEKDLVEAKLKLHAGLRIARALKPDNHESLSAIRMLYSWLEDELNFSAQVAEGYAREMDQE
ncbi:hypothetical protein HQ531_03440 [bacterium]|nr:hypothetical protein [bacterium]